MDRKAIREAAVLMAALSKWEYWHGNRERSEDLNRVAAHLVMVASFSTMAEINAMRSYERGAQKLIDRLHAEMESISWPE
jgi:hypothetical protein